MFYYDILLPECVFFTLVLKFVQAGYIPTTYPPKKELPYLRSGRGARRRKYFYILAEVAM
jgi:hypothetical protein